MKFGRLRRAAVKKLLSRVLIGVAAGVAIYVAFSIWADARSVGQALAGFAWTAALGALGLAAANYLVRFVRWHYYLRVLGLTVPAGESFLVFLAGFALTVTPGKLGEAVKAVLLRESRGIPAARTAPIVVAERFTDLVGLLLLAAVGVFSFDVDRRFLVARRRADRNRAPGGLGRTHGQDGPAAGGARARRGGLRRKLESSTGAPRPCCARRRWRWRWRCRSSPGGSSAWRSGWWCAVSRAPASSMQAATFIYAAMTVAGALSFLPGGLGVTEAGMLALLKARDGHRAGRGGCRHLRHPAVHAVVRGGDRAPGAAGVRAQDQGDSSRIRPS